MNEQLRNLAITRGMDAIAQAKLPVLDLAANYDESICIDYQQNTTGIQCYGSGTDQFLIENISRHLEVEAALDKRTSMGIVGNLGALCTIPGSQCNGTGRTEPKMEGWQALVWELVCMASGSQMGNVFQPNTVQGNNAAPPPLPAAVNTMRPSMASRQACIRSTS